MSRPKNLQKIEEIRKVIARLFASKGYHSTSLREIARELGMNQSSLYHYFNSKEEILFGLMNSAMDDALQTLEGICAESISPEDKLDKVLGFYTRYYAGDQDLLVLLVNEMNSLGENYRPILIEKQRRYVRLIQSILVELFEQQKMKDIHPAVAAFAFFGMVHYTIKWYHREGPIGLDELTAVFLEIFTKGIFR
jgi:AcrR family transcriptional regulator